MKALSVGLPGREKSSVTPFAWAQRSRSRLTNSEPCKLEALIDPDRLRIAHRVADPFEGRDNVFGPMAEPRIDDGREPAECVHDGEDADLLTTGQLVRDEVHGPDLVGCGSCATIVAQLRLPSSLRRLVAQLQAQFVVNPMGCLQIDLPALASQRTWTRR